MACHRVMMREIGMKKVEGFTLVELAAVVLVLGILLAVALPSYQKHVTRSYRSEGMALLNDAAARQERFFAQNNSYVTTAASIADLGLPNTSGTTVTSTTGKYSLTVGTAANDGGYTLTAGRQGPQLRDTECGDLTLDATGRRGATATGADVDACWR